MIQKEKLVQFYFSQYRDSAMALKKKNNDGKKTYEQRIGRLITEMQRTKTGKLTQPHLEEYHRQIRNMAYYAGNGIPARAGNEAAFHFACRTDKLR